MTKVLLMDNVVTPHGSMLSGCQTRLRKLKVECVVDAGRVGPNQPTITDLDEMAERLISLVIQHGIEGIVLDVDWGQTISFSGYEIWQRAKELGLKTPKECVAFLTQHRDERQLPEDAEKLGLDTRQVQYKHDQGNDVVVGWLRKQLDF